MNLCEWSNGRCSSTGFIFWVSRVKTLSALCCMHTEVRFRWAEAGEPRRDRILRPSGSQAELWPRLARRRHANGRVQTGSSVFRQKQRCKTGNKKHCFSSLHKQLSATFNSRGLHCFQVGLHSIQALRWCTMGSHAMRCSWGTFACPRPTLMPLTVTTLLSLTHSEGKTSRCRVCLFFTFTLHKSTQIYFSSVAFLVYKQCSSWYCSRWN